MCVWTWWRLGRGLWLGGCREPLVICFPIRFLFISATSSHPLYLCTPPTAPLPRSLPPFHFHLDIFSLTMPFHSSTNIGPPHHPRAPSVLHLLDSTRVPACQPSADESQTSFLALHKMTPAKTVGWVGMEIGVKRGGCENGGGNSRMDEEVVVVVVLIEEWMGRW